jgi:glycosyltransferase involved in cell wall biosynthesis
MKVGVYLPGYSPDFGGGYTFEREIIHSLDRLASTSRHTFTVFLPEPDSGILDPASEWKKLDVIHLQNGGSFVSKVRRSVSRWILGQSWEHELQVAAQKAMVDIMWFVTPLSRPVDIPYIATVWDLQHRLQPWFPEVGKEQEWRDRENYFSPFLKRASYIITGTQVGKNEIIEFYQIPPERIRILPHPTPAFSTIRKKKDDSWILKKYNIPPDYLFYPAQFWAHKNHANLLYAIKNIRVQHGISFPVVFVGSDKGNLSYLKSLVQKLSLAEQIYFLGFVPVEDLIALYQHSQELVYVSFFGPENLPPLEAFSLECPVIAAAVDGAEEQLGDAAILVDPTKPDDIANAILLITKDARQRKKLIRLGKERAASWNGDRYMQAVFSILDEFHAIRRTWMR